MTTDLTYLVIPKCLLHPCRGWLYRNPVHDHGDAFPCDETLQSRARVVWHRETRRITRWAIFGCTLPDLPPAPTIQMPPAFRQSFFGRRFVLRVQTAGENDARHEFRRVLRRLRQIRCMSKLPHQYHNADFLCTNVMIDATLAKTRRLNPTEEKTTQENCATCGCQSLPRGTNDAIGDVSISVPPICERCYKQVDLREAISPLFPPGVRNIVAGYSASHISLFGTARPAQKHSAADWVVFLILRNNCHWLINANPNSPLYSAVMQYGMNGNTYLFLGFFSDVIHSDGQCFIHPDGQCFRIMPRIWP